MLKRMVSVALLVFLFSSSLAGCVGRAGAQTATITRVSGEVMFMKAGTATWGRASTGTVLQPGDRIRTGIDSSALVTSFEGSVIELQGETEVAFKELNISSTGSITVKLRQEIGTTASRVEKLVDPASRYEVETPAGTALVRGTIMGVIVLWTGMTIIDAIQGQCWAVAQGAELLLSDGMRGFIYPGQTPSTGSQAAGSGAPAGAGQSSSSGPAQIHEPSGSEWLRQVPPPNANFRGYPTSSEAYPVDVKFTDLSTGRISSWFWQFGDEETSHMRNPTHTYDMSGLYTVTLTVVGVGGCDTETKVDYISIGYYNDRK